jgi:hypothetical protein
MIEPLESRQLLSVAAPVSPAALAATAAPAPVRIVGSFGG